MVKNRILTIYNLDGEIVKQVSTIENVIDMKLKENVYFLKVFDNQGQVLNCKKMIVS
jgi:hypothetical protein